MIEPPATRPREGAPDTEVMILAEDGASETGRSVVAPTAAAGGPQRQYRRLRMAIPGGSQASEYSAVRLSTDRGPSTLSCGVPFP